jgi:hypothetical protein
MPSNLERVIDSSSQFINELEAASARLERSIISAIQAGRFSSGVDAALIKNELDNLLIKSGYFKAAESVFSEGYQNTIEAAFEGYKAEFKDSFQFSEASLNIMDSIKTVDFEQFRTITQMSMQSMNKTLLSFITGAVSEDALIEEMTRIFKNNSAHAATAVQDGIMGYYNQANIRLALDAGLTKFVYRGRLIKTSREFCIKHANKPDAHTLPEWEKIAQAEGLELLPFAVYRGGYNCQHVLLAVE